MKPPLQHHALAQQGHEPQHDEGYYGLEPDHKLEVSVLSDEDLAQKYSELGVGGQAQHGSQKHEVAQQACWSDHQR